MFLAFLSAPGTYRSDALVLVVPAEDQEEADKLRAGETLLEALADADGEAGIHCGPWNAMM